MELIDKLGIDLKLLAAQIVNFFILLFVLYKLLYKPILNLLEKRKKMIEKNVLDTKRIEERLTQIESEKKEILSKASGEAMQIIEKAKKESEEAHVKIIENAKKEISQLAERYRTQLRDEKSMMIKELKTEVSDLVIRSSEKILQKEFTKDDQEKLEDAIKSELRSVK